MVRVVSYNCNSIRNNSEVVKSLLNEFDIVLLQELMLEKRDLDILDDFDNEFSHIAFVRDRESEGICEGRPSRGVAIFWRVSLSRYVLPVYVDDSIIGIILNSENFKILMLNVYMPCDMQNADAFYKYRNSLAVLEAVIREQEVNQMILAGDFNADPSRGRFWGMLNDFCQSMSLVILDRLFPRDTFTYLCPTKDSTSWLDHIVCTEQLTRAISNVSVGYGAALFDHFPVCFEIDISVCYLVRDSDNECVNEFVKWHKMKNDDKLEIRDYIDRAITGNQLLLNSVFGCCDMNCKEKCHIEELVQVVTDIKKILIGSTGDFSFRNKERFKIIPGWNDYVRNYYIEARKHFIKWVLNEKPSNGVLREKMRYSRKEFRSALSKCKQDEKDIRNEKLLANLVNKNHKAFWNGVHKTNNHNKMLPVEIDGFKNDNDISSLFSMKYQKILCRKANQSSDCKRYVLTDKQKVEMLFKFSKNDIKEGIRSLKDNIGFDNIHSNHLKFESELLVELLAATYSGFIVHGYVPIDILKGIITPIVKDKFGDLSKSDNYRPVMSSSVLLKLFEYCLLHIIEDYIVLDDRQHGFRKNYSTATACFTLKETILNFTESNSDIYTCFIDISKAFDSVNHEILIKKLSETGIPQCITRLIEFWYRNQFVKVKYRSCFSSEWKVGNGVRQGGVLSGLFFNIYINSVLSKISKLKAGCSLGIMKSNIIAYADDIVLIAPSRKALQYLVDEAFLEAFNLELGFNFSKSKSMIFYSKGKKRICKIDKLVEIDGHLIDNVESIKYLGYYLSSTLDNADDINRVKSKFYVDFNVILRKFNSAHRDVKLYLFKQYCLQFYGSELWFGGEKRKSIMRQFGVGFHKAVKKLLGFSSHESNHFACQEANILMFNHLVNKLKVNATLRFFTKPCAFISKILDFLYISSSLLRNVSNILRDVYEIETLIDNDFQAILSRIWFVQNHEDQMRQHLEE